MTAAMWRTWNRKIYASLNSRFYNFFYKYQIFNFMLTSWDSSLRFARRWFVIVLLISTRQLFTLDQPRFLFIKHCFSAQTLQGNHALSNNENSLPLRPQAVKSRRTEVRPSGSASGCTAYPSASGSCPPTSTKSNALATYVIMLGR